METEGSLREPLKALFRNTPLPKPRNSHQQIPSIEVLQELEILFRGSHIGDRLKEIIKHLEE